MNHEQYKASRKISNALAALIRSGDATPAQVAEYETRDRAERAYLATTPRKPWFFGKTCDELGLMP